MKLIYTDLETGFEQELEGMESITFHSHEALKFDGSIYYVLTINDRYPEDVVECTAFRITA